MDMDEIMKNAGNKLNKARDVALDWADKAGKKANEVYDVVKIRIKIADIRRDINSLYREIGMAAFDARNAGEDISAVIADKCAEVERLNGEIEELSRKAEAEAETDGAIDAEAWEAEADSPEETPAEEPKETASEEE